MIGVWCLAVLLAPSLERLRVSGPMNTGHEYFKCETCHEAVPGAIRQQIQGSMNYWLGRCKTPVDFGHRDVTADVCLGCHERPDDRHPVYRFF